jgi:hypothetical protein
MRIYCFKLVSIDKPETTLNSKHIFLCLFSGLATLFQSMVCPATANIYMGMYLFRLRKVGQTV